MTMRKIVSMLPLCGLLCGAALAADLPGARDPQYLKRFQGSQIINYVSRSFDQYSFATGPGKPVDGFSKSEAMEGKVTRVIYQIPSGHTALELLRNYQNMLTQAGLQQVFAITPCKQMEWGGYFVDRFYGQGGVIENSPYHSMSNGCYVYAKGMKDGKQVGVAVLVAEMNANQNFRPTGTTLSLPIKTGDVIVQVDQVIAMPVANGMAR
jgi:hypothetical protein